MATPIRPRPISKSTTSSTSSKASTRTAGSLFDRNETELPGSPITPPDELIPRHGKSKRPPDKRRSARITKKNKGTIYDEESSDEQQHPPSPTPVTRKHQRPGRFEFPLSSPSDTSEPSSDGEPIRPVFNRQRERVASSPTLPLRLTQLLEAEIEKLDTTEKEQKSPVTFEIPGTYQDSTVSTQSSASTTIVVSTSPVDQGPQPWRDLGAMSEAGNDSDCGSESSGDEVSIPQFVPYRSQGTLKQPKTLRSINYLILECLRTVSKRKKKSASDAELGGIYVFEALGHAPYHLKVGKTYRDPRKRREEWEKCKVPLVEVDDFNTNPFDHFDIVESLLQAELHNLRREYKCAVCFKTHNEWFETDRETVTKIITRWRTWIVEQQPFDEKWKLTPYWQWRVTRTKGYINDVQWDDWIRPSTRDRLYHDFFLPWKPHFDRKDGQFLVRGIVFGLLFWILYGWKCSVLVLIALLSL